MFSHYPTEQKPIGLTFRDLIFMHNEGLILRCSTIDKAQQEKRDGGEGDFISLATFAIPGNNKEMYRAITSKIKAYQSSLIPAYCKRVSDWDNMEEFDTRHALYSLLLDEFLPSELRKDLEAWQKSLVQHMETSLYKHMETGLLYCLYEGKKLALLLGKRPKIAASNPHNFDFYPLGKFGKQRFSSGDIDCLIEVEALGVPVQSEAKLYGAEVEAISRKILPKFYEKLINVIKEKSSRYWNEQLQPSTQSQISFWNKAVTPSAYVGFKNYQQKKDTNKKIVNIPCMQ